MVVLEWIGQIILFFVAWRLLHFLAYRTRQSMTVVMELLTNAILSVILLVVLDNLHSAWWLMLIVGAAVGVITGQMAGRVNTRNG